MFTQVGIIGVVCKQPENILLSSDGDDYTIKLADFGFAKVYIWVCMEFEFCVNLQFFQHIANAKGERALCGTPEYAAPELLRRKPYDQGVDIWSCGVVVFILLSGYAPFDDDDKKELYKKIMQGLYSFKE